MDRNRGYRHPFVFGIHYLGGVGDVPRTLVDLAMSQFSAEIRRSSEWWKYFKEKETRQKWTEYALERTWIVLTPSAEVETQLSRGQIDYVLDELEGYAALRDDELKCQVSCFERIWESDSLLDSAVTRRLIMAFDMLKSNPLSAQDGAISHIIDHRLHPLIYNRTLVSHRDGKFRPIPPPHSSDIYTMSTHFAFLPSDVCVSPTGASVKFMSYINNLHPDDDYDTYKLLETLLKGFIPLFEHVLTDLHRNNPLPQRICGGYRYLVWEEPEPPEYSDDEDGWATYEKEMRQWALNRPINIPNIPQGGYQGGIEARKHVVKLKGRCVQFVISATEISLTPQNRSYPGSTWRVEGMKNDRIVACGFYCLSMDNITESSVEFRMAVTYPRGFTAGDTGATLRTWGVRDGDSCNQHIGYVPIRPGLALVFPNIYQHRETSFELLDDSRCGHLKAVWFYLVDPEIDPVISTSRVGPQQESWVHKALDDFLDKRLPHEVIERILGYVEGMMSVEEAMMYKKRLLEENHRFTQANNSYHFCIPFDIWNGPEIIH